MDLAQVASALTEQIGQGENMLRQNLKTSYSGGSGYLPGEFLDGWHATNTLLLQKLGDEGESFSASYSTSVGEQDYEVKAALDVLRNAVKAIGRGFLVQAKPAANSLETTLKICDRFHRVVTQLRSRHSGRSTLDVVDEYDVQDLMHALLRLEFDDVRAEENVPSYANKNTRMDFIIPAHEIGIEVKMTRRSMAKHDISTELIEDTARYASHGKVKTLVCFVYDPIGFLGNPAGIEGDLSGTKDKIDVVVKIRPNA